MHVERFVRGKGQFMLTEYVATEERVGPRFPLLADDGAHPLAIQCRRADAAHRQHVWHEEDVLEIHPFDAEKRGVSDGDLVALQSRSGEIALRARVSERMQPGVVYTTFHHRRHRRQCRDHREFRLGDQLSGIQGDGGAGPADQPPFGLAGARSGRGDHAAPHRESAGRCRRMKAGSVEVEARSFSYDAGAVGPTLTRAIAVEAPVQIVIGGSPFAVMMATPRDLEDFAYGFALSEGIVGRIEDIRGVEIERVEEGWRVAIALTGERLQAHLSRKRAMSGRTGCGLCGIEDFRQMPSPRRRSRPARRSNLRRSARRSPSSSGAQPLNATDPRRACRRMVRARRTDHAGARGRRAP